MNELNYLLLYKDGLPLVVWTPYKIRANSNDVVGRETDLYFPNKKHKYM